ncbi:MAG: hypothetical protein OXP75_00580 [Rhodospirillales bacterium]|nr:hypothetical protein [Rhodospirillales bacterium]
MVLLLIPGASWAFYKPVRVLVPELNGATCVSDAICMEDVPRYQEASALYGAALEFVNATVGEIEVPPRAVFCSTQDCFESFGFDRAVAHTVGVSGMSGIVVGPRGWKGHFMRHEIIHHLQAERLGVFEQWCSPEWFKEGMAYALSQDPRPVLSEPWQGYRSRFGEWFQSVGRKHLWVEAAKL